MAIYRRSLYRPLSGTQTQLPMARYDLVVLHTMVGTLTGTDALFRRDGFGGTESHFGIGGRWGDNRDGHIIQWQDTTHRADAQLDGNHRSISIETADNFPRSAADILPWTPAQLSSIVEVTAWACRVHDIPAVLVPDSRPGRRGIAYHRLGCEHSRGVGKVPGFLVAGGERWSNAIGKECPGPQRIAQMPEIVARVRDRLAGPTVPAAPARQTPTQKDVEMTPEQILAHKVKLTDADARNMSIEGEVSRSAGDLVSVEYLLKWGGPGLFRLLDAVRDLTEDVRDLSAKIDNLQKGTQ